MVPKWNKPLGIKPRTFEHRTEFFYALDRNDTPIDIYTQWLQIIELSLKSAGQLYDKTP